MSSENYAKLNDLAGPDSFACKRYNIDFGKAYKTRGIL